MDRSDVCKLISVTSTKNAYGVLEPTETEREVFCAVRSVSHREKLENGLIGVAKTYQLSMFRFDYDGEEIVEFNGDRYRVYDITEWNDQVRIYIQEEKGA